jgi:hypothetical protein
MGATFVAGTNASKDALVVEHGPFTVRVETFVKQVGNAPVTFTGARAYFLGLRDLHFRARPRNFMDRVLAAFGIRGLQRLDRTLVDRFVVRGGPPARIPSLFADRALPASLIDLGSASLSVKKASRKSRRRLGDGAGVVACRVTGVTLDPQVLRGLVAAVTLTLDALERMGEARGLSPDRST